MSGRAAFCYGFIAAVLLAGCDANRVVGNQDAAPIDARVLADTTVPPSAGCGGLESFAKPKSILAERPRRALFDPSLKRVVITTHKDNAAGDIHVVFLPSLVTKKLAASVDAVEWLDAADGVLLAARKTTPGGAYDLVEIRLDGKLPERPVAKDVCRWRISNAGRRVYVVQRCTPGGVGELSVHVRGDATYPLAKGVATGSLALHKDARLAFIADYDAAPGCLDTAKVGVASTVDTTRKVTAVAPAAINGSLQFLPSGGLLLQTSENCGQQRKLVRAIATGGGTIELASNLDFASPGLSSDPLYTVTPDEKSVIAVDASGVSGPYTLYAIALDGSGTRTKLATDVFPYSILSMLFAPWKLSGSGSHVVYASWRKATGDALMSLSAVVVDGKQPPMPLFPVGRLVAGMYVIAGYNDVIAVLDKGHHSIERAAVNLGHEKSLYVAQGSLSRLSALPDGRGVVFLEGEKVGTKLMYVGEGALFLGEELATWAHGVSVLEGAYVIDPKGCSVLFQRLDGSEGTMLGLLPR